MNGFVNLKYFITSTVHFTTRSKKWYFLRVLSVFVCVWYGWRPKNRSLVFLISKTEYRIICIWICKSVSASMQLKKHIDAQVVNNVTVRPLLSSLFFHFTRNIFDFHFFARTFAHFSSGCNIDVGMMRSIKLTAPTKPSMWNAYIFRVHGEPSINLKISYELCQFFLCIQYRHQQYIYISISVKR